MMKTIKSAVSLFFFMMIGVISNAQLKVFQNGTTSVGTLEEKGTSEVKAEQLRVLGNSIFTSKWVKSYEQPAGAFIRGNHEFSGPTNPEYSWFNDQETGMYHPNYGVIEWTVLGEKAMKLNAIGHLTVDGIQSSGAHSINVGGKTIGTSAFGGYSLYELEQEYRYGVTSYINRPLTKAFVVHDIVNPEKDPFFVLGDGRVLAQGVYINTFDNPVVTVDDLVSGIAKVLPMRPMASSSKTNNSVMFLEEKSLREHAPEVLLDLPDSTTYVDYNKVVVLLVKSIQEQNARINVLSNVIDELQDPFGLKGKVVEQNKRIQELELLVQQLLEQNEE